MPFHLPSLIVNSLEEQGRKKESGAYGSDDDALSLNIWDFAGQDVYYTTHQVFLTWRAVYVIVFDLSKSLDSVVQLPGYQEKEKEKENEYEEVKGASKLEMTCLEFIHFWLCSIFAHAVEPDSVTTKYTGDTAQKSPPIFIVGTHRDSIKGDKKEQTKKIASVFDAIRETIKGKPFECQVVRDYYAIENSLEGNGEQLNALREHIERVAKEEPYMGEEIPLRWLLFEEMLAPDKINSNYVKLDETKQLTRPFGIESEHELLTVLAFYHDLGYIVYYRDVVEQQSLLKDIVILNPQWLIDVFKQVITILHPAEREGIVSLVHAWSILEKDGILEDCLIQHMWQGFLEQKDALVELMEKFDLICEIPGKRLKQQHQERNIDEVSEVQEVDRKRYYVPSLISSRFPDEEMGHIKSCIDFYVDFKGFLPDGLFHRLMSRTVRWIEERDGQEVSLFHRHVRLMADKEHRVLLKMLPPHEAMIKVTIFRFDDVEFKEVDVNISRRPPAPHAVREVMDFLAQTLESLRLHWAKRIMYEVYFPCEMCGKKKLFKECFNKRSIQCGQDPDVHTISTDSIMSIFGLPGGADTASASSQPQYRLTSALSDLLQELPIDHTHSLYKMNPQVKTHTHKGEDDSEIRWDFVTDTPPELMLQDDETVISCGIRFFPSGAKFTNPVKVTLDHNAHFTNPRRAEIVFYTRHKDTSFVRIPASANGYPRCVIRTKDLDLFVDHFCEWWIVTKIKELLGKRFICTPYLKGLQPVCKGPRSTVRLCISDDLKDVKKELEDKMKEKHEELAPSKLLLVKWKSGDLVVSLVEYQGEPEVEVKVDNGERRKQEQNLCRFDYETFWVKCSDTEATQRFFKFILYQDSTPKVETAIRFTLEYDERGRSSFMDASEEAGPSHSSSPSSSQRDDDEFDKILQEVARRLCRDQDIEDVAVQLGFSIADATRYRDENWQRQRVTYRGTLNMLRTWQNHVDESQERALLRAALIRANQIRLSTLLGEED